MFVEHESPVGRIAAKPVFEVGYPTLGALLDIRFVVAFCGEESDLRSIHSNEPGDDGNAESSADSGGPGGTMNALAECLSFDCVWSPGHNISGSHHDLPLTQSTHDVPHDRGRRCGSRQNVTWPQLSDVLEHELTTRRRARFAHEQSGGAKVVQSSTAEHSANAVRNENNDSAFATAESLIFGRPSCVNDRLAEES